MKHANEENAIHFQHKKIKAKFYNFNDKSRRKQRKNWYSNIKKYILKY